MTQSLIIKDGNGATKSLTVESSSYGYVPVHSISSSAGNGTHITASAAYPVYVTGAVNAVSSQTPAIGGTVQSILSSSFTWTTALDDGTVTAAGLDFTRKGVMIFNPGPNNLYIAITTNGAGGQRGFIISNTASAPDAYSFILYPSGTYTSDPSNATLYHALYFISGSTNPYTLVTKTY